MKTRYIVNVNAINALSIIPLILYGFLRQYFQLPQSILLLYLLLGGILSALWLTQNFNSQVSKDVVSIFIFFTVLILAISRNNQVYNDIIASCTAMTSILIGFYTPKETIRYLLKLLKVLGLITTLLVILDAFFAIKPLGINLRFQYLPSSFLQAQFTILYFIDLQFLKKYAITIPALIFGLTGLAVNFGRGSLIFTILMISILSYLKALKEQNYFRLIILVLLIVIPTAIVVNLLIAYDLFNFRIFNLIDNVNAEPRFEVWSRFDLNNINLLFGEGLSGYKNFYRTHPHNIMLQIFIDTGIIGLFAIVLLLRKSILGFFYINLFKDKIQYTLVVMLSLYLVTSFFSGNLYYNFALFFFLGSGMRLLVKN